MTHKGILQLSEITVGPTIDAEEIPHPPVVGSSKKKSELRTGGCCIQGQTLGHTSKSGVQLEMRVQTKDQRCFSSVSTLPSLERHVISSPGHSE